MKNGGGWKEERAVAVCVGEEVRVWRAVGPEDGGVKY